MLLYAPNYTLEIPISRSLLFSLACRGVGGDWFGFWVESDGAARAAGGWLVGPPDGVLDWVGGRFQEVAVGKEG